MGGVCAPNPAIAHGQLPAVLGVTTADGKGPVLVRLTAGLAVRDPAQAKQYQFVCSARWIAPRSPLLTGMPEGQGYIASEDGFYRVDVAGKVTKLAVAGVDPLAVRAIGSAAGEPLALVVSKGAARAHAIGRPAVGGASPTVWTGSGEWYGARSSADAMWIAQSGGAVVRVVGVRGDGTHSDELVAVDSSTATASVAWVAPNAQKLYLSLIGKATQRIVEVDRSAPASGPRSAKVLFQDYPFVAGPVPVAGKSLAVVTGVLVDVATHPPGQVDDSRWYTCLDSALRADGGVSAFACSKGAVYAIDAAGKPAALVFALDHLTAPDYAGLDDIGRYACWAEWSDFARDSGLDPGPEPAGVVPPVGTDGCTAGRSGPDRCAALWPCAGLAVAALVSLRRRRTAALR